MFTCKMAGQRANVPLMEGTARDGDGCWTEAGDAGTQGLHVHMQGATALPKSVFAAWHTCPRHKVAASTLSYCCRAEVGPFPAQPTAALSPL